MDLIQRLFRVVRANMDAGYSPFVDAAPDFEIPDDGFPAPPQEPSQDPVLAGLYANLELPYGAGREEVRVAWKRLMKRYHPDLHAADPDKRRIADQLAAELTRAYQQLDSLLAETAA
tara:strand:+ start:377 stop:727 length:351 start_codon:yes stop_codon:yes gene_type:complete